MNGTHRSKIARAAEAAEICGGTKVNPTPIEGNISLLENLRKAIDEAAAILLSESSSHGGQENRYHRSLFDDLLEQLESESLESYVIATAEMRQCWHAFVVTYQESESFISCSEEERKEYLTRFLNFVEMTAHNESSGKTPQGSSHGASLVLMYVTALSCNDVDCVNYMADCMDSHNRYAFEIAVASGQAEPDDQYCVDIHEQWADKSVYPIPNEEWKQAVRKLFSD